MATILVTDFSHLCIFGNEPEREVKEKEKDKEREKEKENKIENKTAGKSKEDENKNTEKVSLCCNFMFWESIETIFHNSFIQDKISYTVFFTQLWSSS